MAAKFGKGLLQSLGGLIEGVVVEKVGGRYNPDAVPVGMLSPTTLKRASGL
jgi:hypothetical protein